MSILSQVNLDLSLEPAQYGELLDRYQDALRELGEVVVGEGRPVVIVLEGWHAAGKGGTLRRLTERLDPRIYTVHAIREPDGEEADRHYLYRFWRRLPERGHIAVFDRSWYGRVLHDRVEGVCTGAEWKRAYREINQFERQLLDHSTILLKFWLHISREEQRRRLEEMVVDRTWPGRPAPEEWEQQASWEAYTAAVEEMLLKTSALDAPWTIVEAEDKRWARVKVLRTTVGMMCREMKCEPDIIGGGLRRESRKLARRDSVIELVSEETAAEMMGEPSQPGPG